MKLDLPEPYRIGRSAKQAVRTGHHLMGSEWSVLVHHYVTPAFQLIKQYDIYTHDVKYSGRMVDRDGFGIGSWQQFSTMKEAVRVMCIKHRIGVGSKLQHTGD